MIPKLAVFALLRCSRVTLSIPVSYTHLDVYKRQPCDSLLNLALHVYHEEAKEHALALLYKGKVQQEMENLSLIHI